MDAARKAESADVAYGFAIDQYKISRRVPPGGSARNLLHLGGYVFSPVGAEIVRIKFGIEAGKAVTLSVHDPEPRVSAKRTDQVPGR